MPQFPSTTSASGIWTLKKQKRAAQGSNWPPLVLPDFQFNYVTMLLHGNGTNGAQNNTFLDSSTNAFSMTRNGTITQGTFSPYGSSWSNYFDGSGDRLEVTSQTALGMGAGDFTYEAWVYVNETVPTNAIRGLFDSRVGGATGCGIYTSADSGTTAKLVYATNSAIVASSTNQIPSFTWSHIAVTRSSGTVRGFIDGTLQFTVTDSRTFSSSAGTYIGSDVNSLYFNGYISNARILKGTALYTSAFTPPTAPLTAITNTSLLTCHSNQFRDASTNNFAITPTGDVSVEKFSPFLSSTEYSAATVGGSAYGAGTGYLTTTGQCLPQGTSDCCVEFWWYPMNFSNTIGFCKANVSQGISFEYQGAGSFGSVSFEIYTSGAGGVSSLFGGNAYASTGRFQVKQWNHVAYVRTGDTHSIYCNGIRLYTNTAVIGLDWAASTNNLILTSFTSQRFLNGYVSSFRSVVGSSPYNANNTTITVPTSQLTAITNTRLLLNFTNGGIIDNAMMNDLETVGNAQISTSVSKFGGGSMAFDGSGDYLFASNNPSQRIMGGDFTVEMWMYLGAAQANMGLVSSYENNNGWIVRLDTTYIRFFYGISGSGTANDVTYSFSPGVWYHIAWVKSGTSLRCYINGTQQGSTFTVSGAVDTTTAGMQVGRTQTTSNDFNGYIDDLRITKGYARYTANFTPPAAPFPDKGAL